MKKVFRTLLMFSMALFVTCFAAAIGTKSADAMSTSSIYGTYRIVQTGDNWERYSKGGLIEFVNTDNGLTGIAKNSPSNGDGFKQVKEVIRDIWQDGGTVHCSTYFSLVPEWRDAVMTSNDNGNTIRVVEAQSNLFFWVLKRVQ